MGVRHDYSFMHVFHKASIDLDEWIIFINIFIKHFLYANLKIANFQLHFRWKGGTCGATVTRSSSIVLFQITMILINLRKFVIGRRRMECQEDGRHFKIHISVYFVVVGFCFSQLKITSSKKWSCFERKSEREWRN